MRLRIVNMPILPLVAQTIGDFTFPIPTNNVEIFWVLLGIQFAYAFGSKLDYEMQQTEWFKKLDPVLQGTLKRIMDFLHHWWMGAFLWLYAEQIAIRIGVSNYSTEILFFGLGILFDDIRDIENLKRRYGIEDDDDN